MPSTAADFKGLLKSAIRDDNPVLFFSDIALEFEAGEVPDSEEVVPIGKAALRRDGTDVTLISYAKTVHTCLQAADRLAERGISAQVVDLRTLKPLDEETILAAVRKTGRAIVVHEASRMCGVGAEVASILAEKAFDALQAPIIRLTGPDVPPPASFPLEQAFVPQADAIVEAAARIVGGRRTATNRIEEEPVYETKGEVR
jgi:pyruvate/2-oxoglutarate/acetoin dehydrogenase E1 component